MEDTRICRDCLEWNNNDLWKNTLRQNRSVFTYNMFMKDVLATFKYRGDAELVNCFEQPFLEGFKKYYSHKKYQVVPIPISPERLRERGFNQALLLAKLLKKPIFEPLGKRNSLKQSKKTKKERIDLKDLYILPSYPSINGYDILLVDDLYTTGSTLRHASKILKMNGASSVDSLTLIRS
ncbi:phosphoribosyltransferase family protein [Bacillus carboniphilus]|uniref:Phosphoribosyltransferase family protein n=1 Tax=Bacillus carboniphilus TaxID=86663 RepID=A0ABY9JT78_9BACI|nr:phosphoribosyltransferase family protein [Bacillus carboniphilus]WLR41493.1 phosphoribosyltransferase family protein [Bacillus carboniphilus]